MLVRVNDFRPSVFIAAPQAAGRDGDTSASYDSPADRERLKAQLNRSMPADSRIHDIIPQQRLPLMYYRPDRASGGTYLQLVLPSNGSARKAGTALEKLLNQGLQQHGLTVTDTTVYEAEINLLQRFMCDASVSGACWLYILPIAATQRDGAPVAGSGGSAPASSEAVVTPPPAKRARTAFAPVTPGAALSPAPGGSAG